MTDCMDSSVIIFRTFPRWGSFIPHFLFCRLCGQWNHVHGYHHFSHSLQHRRCLHLCFPLLQVKKTGEWYTFYIIYFLMLTSIASLFCTRCRRRHLRPGYRSGLEQEETYTPSGDYRKGLIDHSCSMGSGSGSGLPRLVGKEQCTCKTATVILKKSLQWINLYSTSKRISEERAVMLFSNNAIIIIKQIFFSFLNILFPGAAHHCQADPDG